MCKRRSVITFFPVLDITEMPQSQKSTMRLHSTANVRETQRPSSLPWILLVGDKEICVETQHDADVVGILHCPEDLLYLMYVTGDFLFA